MKAAREAGATDRELQQTVRMALRVRQVKVDEQDKFTVSCREILKGLTGENKSTEEAVAAIKQLVEQNP